MVRTVWICDWACLQKELKNMFITAGFEWCKKKQTLRMSFTRSLSSKKTFLESLNLLKIKRIDIPCILLWPLFSSGTWYKTINANSVYPFDWELQCLQCDQWRCKWKGIQEFHSGKESEVLPVSFLWWTCGVFGCCGCCSFACILPHYLVKTTSHQCCCTGSRIPSRSGANFNTQAESKFHLKVYNMQWWISDHDLWWIHLYIL